MCECVEGVVVGDVVTVYAESQAPLWAVVGLQGVTVLSMQASATRCVWGLCAASQLRAALLCSQHAFSRSLSLPLFFFSSVLLRAVLALCLFPLSLPPSVARRLVSIEANPVRLNVSQQGPRPHRISHTPLLAPLWCGCVVIIGITGMVFGILKKKKEVLAISRSFLW